MFLAVFCNKRELDEAIVAMSLETNGLEAAEESVATDGEKDAITHTVIAILAAITRQV